VRTDPAAADRRTHTSLADIDRAQIPLTTLSVSAGAGSATAQPHGPVGFILGPARSGTSVLYKALCLHPEAAWISNWVARFPRAPWLAGLNRLTRAMPSAARRVWFGPDSNAYVYGRPRPLTDRLFPMPVEGEPVYAACGVGRPGHAADTRIPDPEKALVRAFRTISSAGGGGVLLSKRIANNLRVPLLARAFPDARFVETIRDGRAVASSLDRVDWWRDSYVWWYGGTPAAWEAEGRDPWEICARNWVEEIRELREGLRAVPEDRILRLRYEDLVADPIPTLQRVARFVGLPESEGWLHALRSIEFPNRNDGWRERLDREVADRVTAIQREELETHGYEV
jgi:hypothetical protein